MMGAKDRADYDERLVVVRKANDMWHEVQKELEYTEEIKVTTVPTLQALWFLFTDKQKLIPKKKFDKALDAMARMSTDNDNEVKHTEQAYKIVDALRVKLGIKNERPNLKSLKQRVYNNLIIEGKIT